MPHWNRMGSAQRARTNLASLSPLVPLPPGQLNRHPLNPEELREAVLLCVIRGNPQYAHDNYNASERHVIASTIDGLSSYFSGHYDVYSHALPDGEEAHPIDDTLARELRYLSVMIRDPRDRDPQETVVVPESPRRRSARIGRYFSNPRDARALTFLKHFINQEHTIVPRDIEVSARVRELTGRIGKQTRGKRAKKQTRGKRAKGTRGRKALRGGSSCQTLRSI